MTKTKRRCFLPIFDADQLQINKIIIIIQNHIEKIGKTIETGCSTETEFSITLSSHKLPETISPWRLVCLSRFLYLVFRQAELSFCWTTLKLVSFSFHMSFNRCLVVGVPFSCGFLRPTPSNFFLVFTKRTPKIPPSTTKGMTDKGVDGSCYYYLFIRWGSE